MLVAKWKKKINQGETTSNQDQFSHSIALQNICSLVNSFPLKNILLNPNFNLKHVIWTGSATSQPNANWANACFLSQ